jgi:hypothetical protein
MFATGANALLRIGGAARLVGAWLLAEEDRHELIHPSIREEQVRAVRHQRGRRHDRVLLRLEKIEKRLAYFAAGHNHPA